jgi:DNA-binding HxlR family transcriptional regulator
VNESLGLNDCRTFSAIRQGAPGIPTALLAKRPDGLEQAGIVVRRAKDRGRGASYELTEMGRALQPVVNALGQWGARWLEIQPRHLDASYVLWATMKLVDHDRIPDGTTTVRFDITGASSHYWMLLRRPQSELCTRSNGYLEDLVCATSAATLVDLHLRRVTYAQAMRSADLELRGPIELTKRFGTWFRTSPFAEFLSDGPTGSNDSK